MTLNRFLAPERTSLKICGVTTQSDAERLAEMNVDALGANFWPKSKRFLSPESAGFLSSLSGRILRVGVFVNAGPELPRQLFEDGLIDLIQLHGDETPDDAQPLIEAGIPFIKALGIQSADDFEKAHLFGAQSILLDAHAPGVYGGTGRTMDWNLARDFVIGNPDLPLVLAGGITSENASAAISAVHPAALDIASGAESSPGVKDFEKVAALLAACRA